MYKEKDGVKKYANNSSIYKQIQNFIPPDTGVNFIVQKKENYFTNFDKSYTSQARTQFYSASHSAINFTIQKKEASVKNTTGLPDKLKSGIEHLSGIDISDVKVHYNSSQPTQLNAYAFAQGNQIHIAPGQEKHLPHEAWHVVQQKQGRVKPTKQLKGKVNINDDTGLEKEADVMGTKALQMYPITQNFSISQNKNVTNTIQMQPIPITHSANYRDNRGGPYLLRSLGNDTYEVVQDGFAVTHNPNTDQYLIGGNDVYWDPLTGDAFEHISGRNYRSMFDTNFIYTQGYYHPVPTEINATLTNFLDQIWALRANINELGGTKAKLNLIYSMVYSKSASNTKVAPEHKSPTIGTLVQFSKGKNAHLQFGCPIPPSNERVSDIQLLYKMLNYEPYTENVKIAAYNGLSRGYYYYQIRDVPATTRIILNVAPTSVPAALNTLWPIVSHSLLVQGMKAGGPVAAAQKLDSIIIYANRGQGFDQLLHAIQNAGIATVNLLPGLVTEQAVGIGLADEPNAVNDTNISFGQKRIILAFMALRRANSQEEMRTLGATFFQQAGINTGSPANETGIEPNTGVQAELGELLAIMNTK